jgi:ferredoxin
MAKIPVVDMSQCNMCEGCVEVCPETFQISEGGYIEVIELETYSEECVQEAISCCPRECITWEET